VSLGFTVESLLPKARGGKALTMGLQRIEEGDWLRPEADIAARRAIFEEFPDSISVLPEAAEAGREVAEMLGVDGYLGAAARSIWEDLCILTRADGSGGDTGEYRLTGGAVGFPTDWRLAGKMGLPLTSVHAPIHGYREQLAGAVDHFMKSLKVGPIFGRANWFVVPNDNLRYLPDESSEDNFAGLSVENAGKRLFVRCERQTLRRLPKTMAVLFTISVDVVPLESLGKEALRWVANAVSATSEGEHHRRGAPHYADALSAYADIEAPSIQETAI